MTFIKTYYNEKGIVEIEHSSLQDLETCLDELFFKYFEKKPTDEFIKNAIEFLKNHAKQYWLENPKSFGLEFEGNDGELLDFQFSNPIKKILLTNKGVK